MTQKINGMTAAGQFLTGGLNFYKVRTTLDIRPAGGLVVAEGAPITSQMRLDKLVETISTRAQPVILSAVADPVVEADPDDLVGTNVEVYTLSFAIEHNMAWEVAGSKNPDLAESLNGVAGFINDGIAVGNVSVQLVESL